MSRLLLRRGLALALARRAPLAQFARPAVLTSVRTFAKKKQKGKSDDGPAAAAGGDDDDDAGDSTESTVDPLSDEFEKELKKKFAKTLDSLKSKLGSLRGSTPTPELFDAAQVEAYGSIQPLSAVAHISVRSPTMVDIVCFDAEMAPKVVEALNKLEGMSINPQVNGGEISIPFPRPSAEARAAVAKAAAAAAEKSKVRARNVRQTAHNTLKKAAEGASEDDVHRRGKLIDKHNDDCIKAMVKLLEDKKKDLLG
ncbi:ribosome recycling factor domain-containing protein [Pelagophyceae sp. CCMP2097]|nr:ribosome recycling factor domain-containing protein [Pelagophyceae sp. CCMP2097]